MSVETITHNTLTHLVEAGSIRSAMAISTPDGWRVLVRYGMIERTLAAQRSQEPRHFKKLDTLASYLRALGLPHFAVDASAFSPGEFRRSTRPDRAAAMKAAHRAAKRK